MKRNTLIFLFAVLFNILTVPAINLLTTPDGDTAKWKEKTFLYNTDLIFRWTSLLLYSIGISTDSKQVIVGQNDWLFLGDKYDETRTADRHSPSASDYIRGQEIGAAMEAWNTYLSSKGVKLFKVMIAPNKGTIYSENLPFWAQPSTPGSTDALLIGTGKVNYIDLRIDLLNAKANYSEPFYYKTDTHWNSLGAGVAFHAFAQRVGVLIPEIQ